MSNNEFTIGSYLAARLEAIGLTHFFAIPGDYNLLLLDEFLKNKNLRMIGCCNELNAGYAVDGYARANGFGALVLTYSVGGLSALNAVAGAYAHDLPLLVVSGAPGTDAECENQILHHSLGSINYRYVRQIYEKVTAKAITLRHPQDAAYQIDDLLETAFIKRKPVYLEIPCNIAAWPICKPQPRQFSFTATSDAQSLAAAVEHAACLLNHAKMPVLIAGPQLKSYGAINSFKKLIDASKFPFAALAGAKGFVTELHESFMGIYWGNVDASCTTYVELSDAYLYAGPIFNDYTMAGFTMKMEKARLIHAGADFVRVAGQTYSQVALDGFLNALASAIKPNEASLNKFLAMKSEESRQSVKSTKNSKHITIKFLYGQVQKLLSEQTTIVAETGDSWANGAGLTLPKDCGFEIQLQYASIGWSIGATLGLALRSQRRIITLVGDGAFQMTGQEISTMIRYQLDPIIIVINNHGYLIESLIHDGPYNDIQNWKYSELIAVYNNKNGNAWGCQVKTETELVDAFAYAQNHNGLCLIEVITDKMDGNKNSVEFGKKVAAFNNKPPHCV